MQVAARTPSAWQVLAFMNTNELSGFDYFKLCLTKRYVDFSGRARRAEYWYFALFQLLLYLPSIILIVIGEVTGSRVLPITGVLLGILFFLGLFLPSLAVTVRRLHDTGKSGWLYLITLLPFGGLVIFIFTLMESEPRTNKWGPNPKANIGDVIDHLNIA